jgi:PAS domain S-box-containing protein
VATPSDHDLPPPSGGPPPSSGEGVRSAAVLEAIVRRLPHAVVVGLGERIVLVNDGFAALFQLARVEDALGRSVMEFLVPASGMLVADRLRARREGRDIPPVWRATAVRRDGRSFDAEFESTLVEAHGAIYSVSVVRDVTSAVQIERAAGQADSLYRALFDGNTAVKLLIDPTDGRIVDANEGAEAFYGYSRDELRGKLMGEINEMPRDMLLAEMNAARKGIRRYFRFRHRTKSGEVRPVEVYSGPIEWQGRTLLFSIVHDQSEREGLEEQLRRVQRLEALGTLAGGLAHDFNNLLTIIHTCGRMLAASTSEATTSRENAEAILDAAARARGLTRQLLTLSRRQLVRPQQVRVSLVIARMQRLLHRALGDSVTLEVQTGDDDPAVLADAGQLEQVVMNLAVNARDALRASPRQGGRVVMRTRALEIAPGEDTSDRPVGRYTVLEVEDDGEGMDEPTRARIFEPFFTTKAVGEGVGLGLAVVYGIVRQCGGSAEVLSSPGQGTRFVLTFPGAPEVFAPVEIPKGTSRGGPSDGLRILVVEDNRDVRAVVTRTLGLAGHEIVAAEHAEQAISALEAGRFDVVVSDVVMPGRSGTELAREIRTRWPEIGVLLVSGELRGESLDRLGPHVSFLEKPFSGEELLAAIADVLVDRRGV